MSRSIHLAAALAGPGWHPGADAAGRGFSPRYWTDLAALAENGLLDLITLEDSLSGARRSLDAELLAARIGPTTTHLGLIPTVVAPLTEPFHISKAIATVDHVTSGRAGLRVRTSIDPAEYANVGRRAAPQPDGQSTRATIEALFGEVEDYIEVVRRLWDSWEDDAEIRDVATGRFVDIEKLHYIDFVGEHFSVRGPSITQRPPQGQPLVALLAHTIEGYRLLARQGDLGFVTPADAGDAALISAEVAESVDQAGRTGQVRVLGDVLVVLGDTEEHARERLSALDAAAGAPLTSDARVFVGTADSLADLVDEWTAAGLDGVRLRPAESGPDLARISGDLVPLLQRRGIFRDQYEADTLRGHFGLDRPANRYAAAG